MAIRTGFRGQTAPFDAIRAKDPNLAQTLQGILNAIPQIPGAFRVKAKLGITQSLANNTTTQVLWRQMVYDPKSMIDFHSPDGRVVIREAGVYSIVAGGQFAANAAGRRQLVIRKNGMASNGTAIAVMATPATATGNTQLTVSCHEEFQENEFFCINALQESGGALDLSAVNATFVAAVRVAI